MSALSPTVSVAPVSTAKVGWDAELLLTALSLVKLAPFLTVKEYAGAAAVNSIVAMLALPEMLTAVGAPLLVKVALLVGVAGVQLLPVVHSLPGPVQVASCAMTLLGTAKQTPLANATSIHVEPRADANGPNCLDCIPLHHGRPEPAVSHHPRRTPQKNIPWKHAAGNHLAPLPRQTRAFDAACSDGSLRRRSGGRGLYKSILAVSEGGPDAVMSFRLAARIAAMFDGTVDAVHFAEHHEHESDITGIRCLSSRGCLTTG